ncbi:unnamed protein product [Polarella glacialis]|uniref:J domain-containing protein n=1 Tax=Polarella glacialis TaxID=89957 RepID=A0A813FJN0_POLGL|nr:unnamed protein product [Polarella glacialis]
MARLLRFDSRVSVCLVLLSLLLPRCAAGEDGLGESDGVIDADPDLVDLDALIPAEAPDQNSGGAEATSFALQRSTRASGSAVVALRLVSAVRSTTPEQLKNEIVAAEAALALRAEVDGLPVVYDSPAVSISLRKVSAGALTANGAELECPDGASIKIPADPRVKGRNGGPVTVSVTSYHAGDGIKDIPKVKYGAERRLRHVVGGPDGVSAGAAKKEDRVDFFMTKNSVSWRGTVDVKVPGLAAQVPAHDRPWTPYGSADDQLYPEEKAEVRKELEKLAASPDIDERLRGYRRLARRWHPDKHQGEEEKERATAVFEYLQEVREALGLGSQRSSGGK